MHFGFIDEDSVSQWFEEFNSERVSSQFGGLIRPNIQQIMTKHIVLMRPVQYQNIIQK